MGGSLSAARANPEICPNGRATLISGFSAVPGGNVANDIWFCARVPVRRPIHRLKSSCIGTTGVD